MTTRMSNVWALGGATLAALMAAAGCSSSSAGSGAATNELTGTYVTSDDGPIQQFQFVDSSHVNIWWSQCAEGNACEAVATYTFQGSQLSITDASGNVATLSVTGIGSQTMTQDDKLRILGGGSSLTGGGSTSLGGGTPAALSQLEQLIVEFDVALLIEDSKPSSSGSGSSGLKVCAGSQHFSTATTFPNDRAAFDFFRTKGLSAAQAAGIVGNLDQESGVNPNEYQSGGGPGRGIAQWSVGGRWNSSPDDNAESFASGQNDSAWSLQTQLEFIWYELTERGYGYSELKEQTTVDGAESVFQSKFEICGDCDSSKRQAYAQNVYNAFAKTPVRSSGSSGGTCTQSWGSCSVDGESGSCVDTQACGAGYDATPGHCPGPSNIQCCTKAAKSSGGSTGPTSPGTGGSTAVSRAMEWVDAKLHYCQAAYMAADGDQSCWAWEGSGHRCDREKNSAWDAYRSDCSGFVTFAWGLPAVGDGGYVTGDFAPYSTAISHTIDGIDLQPGDALNKTPDEHIVLFKSWDVMGKSAVFMEEPGCSADPPYAHEFTSDVSISGSLVYIDYEGASFYAIRPN